MAAAAAVEWNALTPASGSRTGRRWKIRGSYDAPWFYIHWIFVGFTFGAYYNCFCFKGQSQLKFVPRAPIDNRRGEQYTRSKTQNAPPAARRALIKGGIRHDPKTVRFAAALRGTGPLPSGWLRHRRQRQHWLRFRPGQQLGQRVQRERPQHHQRGQHLRPAPEF